MNAKMKMAIFRVWIAIMFVPGIVACNNGLSERYDKYLDETPSVCKTYCELKGVCGHSSDLGEFREASNNARVRQCMAECSSYGVEGAYVWHPESESDNDKVMYRHLSGDEVLGALECVFDLGSVGCGQVGSEYTIIFRPVSKSICEKANECIEIFDLDFSYEWISNNSSVGGSCEMIGEDTIDALIF